jgi:hypothetical protein
MEHTCKYPVMLGKKEEKGSWCADCGIKVYGVEDRPCGECIHHKQLFDGGICTEHLMACPANMYVTFSIAKGSCFVPISSTSVK